MTSIAKLTTALCFAGTIFLIAGSPASAQSSSGGDDTWSHKVSPRADGQCWNSTDAANSERGFGYWGTCHAAAPSTGANDQAQGHRHIQHH
jgi:hypothetical protein